MWYLLKYYKHVFIHYLFLVHVDGYDYKLLVHALLACYYNVTIIRYSVLYIQCVYGHVYSSCLLFISMLLSTTLCSLCL